MSINFPSSPTANQIYTDSNTGNRYVYDATVGYWRSSGIIDVISFNAAFDKANAANVLAYNTGISANAYVNVSTSAANNYAGSMANAANNYAGAMANSANAFTVVAFNKANTVPSPGTSSNVLVSNGTSWISGAAPGFASGTVMLFVQTSAPTGWTKSTTHDNKALRVVSGSASSGGTVAFTTAFASKSVAGTVGSFTLTQTEIPSHAHTFSAAGPSGTGVAGSGGNVPYFYTSYSGTTSYYGSSSSHTHSFTGTAIDLAVQYVDTIIATKD